MKTKVYYNIGFFKVPNLLKTDDCHVYIFFTLGLLFENLRSLGVSFGSFRGFVLGSTVRPEV